MNLVTSLLNPVVPVCSFRQARMMGAIGAGIYAIQTAVNLLLSSGLSWAYSIVVTEILVEARTTSD